MPTEQKKAKAILDQSNILWDEAVLGHLSYTVQTSKIVVNKNSSKIFLIVDYTDRNSTVGIDPILASLKYGYRIAMIEDIPSKDRFMVEGYIQTMMELYDEIKIESIEKITTLKRFLLLFNKAFANNIKIASHHANILAEKHSSGTGIPLALEFLEIMIGKPWLLSGQTNSTPEDDKTHHQQFVLWLSGSVRGNFDLPDNILGVISAIGEIKEIRDLAIDLLYDLLDQSENKKHQSQYSEIIKKLS